MGADLLGRPVARQAVAEQSARGAEPDTGHNGLAQIRMPDQLSLH